MPRPFVSAGLVASLVTTVITFGATPATAGEGDPPPGWGYTDCYDTFVSTPVSNSTTVVTACTPDWP